MMMMMMMMMMMIMMMWMMMDYNASTLYFSIMYHLTCLLTMSLTTSNGHALNTIIIKSLMTIDADIQGSNLSLYGFTLVMENLLLTYLVYTLNKY